MITESIKDMRTYQFQDFPNGVSGVVDFLDLNLGPTDLSNIDFNGTNG